MSVPVSAARWWGPTSTRGARGMTGVGITVGRCAGLGVELLDGAGAEVLAGAALGRLRGA